MDAAGRNPNGRHSALWQLTGRSALDIASHGQRREITFAVDPIRQEPVVAVEVRTAENVKNGNSAKLWWPVSACSKLADATVRFLQLADDYTVLNPHLTLSVEGRQSGSIPRCDDGEVFEGSAPRRPDEFPIRVHY